MGVIRAASGCGLRYAGTHPGSWDHYPGTGPASWDYAGTRAGKSAKNGFDMHGYYLIYSTMDPAVPRTFYKWLFCKDLRGLIFCIFGVF